MKFVDWVIRGYDRAAAVSLSRSGINPLVSVFLASRGMTTVEAAQDFLRDDIGCLGHPFLLKDMDAAVARIDRALKGRRAHRRLRRLRRGRDDGQLPAGELPALPAAPISKSTFPAGWTRATGSTSPPWTRSARAASRSSSPWTAGSPPSRRRRTPGSWGIDLIITDHHECKETLPAALAVIDPKRRDCSYPSKALCRRRRGLQACLRHGKRPGHREPAPAVRRLCRHRHHRGRDARHGRKQAPHPPRPARAQPEEPPRAPAAHARDMRGAPRHQYGGHRVRPGAAAQRGRADGPHLPHRRPAPHGVRGGRRSS